MEAGGTPRQLGGNNPLLHHQHQQQQSSTTTGPHPPPQSGRRRTRSTGSLPWLNKQSGDSSSSMGDWEISRDVGVSSLYQSDSDEVSGVAQVKRGLYSLQPPRLFPNIESDSVNENFSPVRPITRRKRKLKRMAVMEVDGGVAHSHFHSHGHGHSQPYTRALVATKKKRILRHCENRYCSWATSGKRKRSSARVCSASGGTAHKRRGEEQQPSRVGDECDAGGGCSITGGGRTVLALHRLTLGDTPPPTAANNMLTPPFRHSSSSLSSSESDPGIYTNDEGREGDDEQSDWVGEATGGGVGGGGNRSQEQHHHLHHDEEDDEEEPPEDDEMVTGSSPPPPVTASSITTLPHHHLVHHHHHHHHHHHRHHNHHRHHIPPDRPGGCSGGGGGREMRGGRRRLRTDRASFTILTSANEQLSKFLRDPAKSQLRLHPMREDEREELVQLADLYSLDMHLTDPQMGLTCPVLTKTSNTMRVEPAVSMSRLHTIAAHSHSKRRRQTPPKITYPNTDIV